MTNALVIQICISSITIKNAGAPNRRQRKRRCPKAFLSWALGSA
jgi:hypothetical protein